MNEELRLIRKADQNNSMIKKNLFQDDKEEDFEKFIPLEERAAKAKRDCDDTESQKEEEKSEKAKSSEDEKKKEKRDKKETKTQKGWDGKTVGKEQDSDDVNEYKDENVLTSKEL